MTETKTKCDRNKNENKLETETKQKQKENETEIKQKLYGNQIIRSLYYPEGNHSKSTLYDQKIEERLYLPLATLPHTINKI